LSGKSNNFSTTPHQAEANTAEAPVAFLLLTLELLQIDEQKVINDLNY
jgi:hypothetical protein